MNRVLEILAGSLGIILGCGMAALISIGIASIWLFDTPITISINQNKSIVHDSYQGYLCYHERVYRVKSNVTTLIMKGDVPWSCEDFEDTFGESLATFQE